MKNYQFLGFFMIFNTILYFPTPSLDIHPHTHNTIAVSEYKSTKKSSHSHFFYALVQHTTDFCHTVLMSFNSPLRCSQLYYPRLRRKSRNLEEIRFL